MAKTSSNSAERKITRLKREISQIDQYFYGGMEDEDRFLYASQLERKRDDIVRSIVLQLHTGIEDILTSHITCHILQVKPDERSSKTRSQPARALRKMLFGAGSLGFDMKLNLALALRLINRKTKDKLMDLNTIRNKCSHNWLLNIPIRHGRRPRQK